MVFHPAGYVISQRSATNHILQSVNSILSIFHKIFGHSEDIENLKRFDGAVTHPPKSESKCVCSNEGSQKWNFSRSLDHPTKKNVVEK